MYQPRFKRKTRYADGYLLLGLLQKEKGNKEEAIKNLNTAGKYPQARVPFQGIRWKVF